MILLCQDVGLGDLLRPLPATNIPWFCDFTLFFFTYGPQSIPIKRLCVPENLHGFLLTTTGISFSSVAFLCTCGHLAAQAAWHTGPSCISEPWARGRFLVCLVPVMCAVWPAKPQSSQCIILDVNYRLSPRLRRQVLTMGSGNLVSSEVLPLCEEHSQLKG